MTTMFDCWGVGSDDQTSDRSVGEAFARRPGDDPAWEDDPLDAASDPILAALWDNERDSVYDDVFGNSADAPPNDTSRGRHEDRPSVLSLGAASSA